MRIELSSAKSKEVQQSGCKEVEGVAVRPRTARRCRGA